MRASGRRRPFRNILTAPPPGPGRGLIDGMGVSSGRPIGQKHFGRMESSQPEPPDPPLAQPARARRAATVRRSSHSSRLAQDCGSAQVPPGRGTGRGPAHPGRGATSSDSMETRRA